MTLEERQRVPFHVIVDEYQNFASESFAVLQSEARKYAVDLIVAHQFRDQLDIQNKGAALNVGNFVAFRTTGVDGPELAAQFDNTPPPPEIRMEPEYKKLSTGQGQTDWYVRAEGGMHGTKYREVADKPRLYSDVAMERANQLANLSPFRALVKIMAEKSARQFGLAEHELALFDPADPQFRSYFGTPDERVAARIRAQSQALARSRAEVETEITERTGGAADMEFPLAYGDLDR
jgi:hypothetical protein